MFWVLCFLIKKKRKDKKLSISKLSSLSGITKKEIFNFSVYRKLVLDAHESNVFVKYELGIGAGTPNYYKDIFGSVSDFLYNEELIIDLEKFKKLFDELGIEYLLTDQLIPGVIDHTYLYMRVESHYNQNTSKYIQDLTILFSKNNGAFECFECTGD